MVIYHGLVGEGSEPVHSAGAAAGPCAVKSIDPHRQCLKPFLDHVPINMPKVTAEIAPRKSGQVTESVDKERRLREIMLVFQFGEVRRSRGRPPPNSFESLSMTAYSHCQSVSTWTVVLSTATRDGCAIIRSLGLLIR